MNAQLRIQKLFFVSFLFLLAFQEGAVAQTASLSLSSSTIVTGTSAALNLSLSGSSGPASLQWTITYPGTSISSITVTAGPALTGGNKSLACSMTAGSYGCIASGVNTGAISDGAVAIVNVTPSVSSGSISLGVSAVSAASPASTPISASGSGGTISVGPVTTVTSLSCAPATISTPGASTCTAVLNTAAPSGGAVVAVSSDNGNLATPLSVTVAAGSTSSVFTVNANTVPSSQGANLTAGLNGSSATAAVTLVPPQPAVLPGSLGCIPSSLVPAGSSTCTVILSGLAPVGGAVISITSNNSALSVPAAVTVPAGSSSVTFTATSAAVSASQAATVGAALGGGSVTTSIILNPSGGPAVLSVGPGHPYAAPCAALTTASDGAMIQIDASGIYTGDVCTVTANNLTIKGVNGRPLVNASGLTSAGQGAWLFQGNNITLDTVELTGAASPGNNGAGIYMSGVNLTVLNSYIHDNQEGLVTSANPKSQILIQSTEFNHNGFGDGATHNIDVNSAARLTLQYSYSHNANAGDLVKSQAAENYILFNRMTSEQGTSNTEVEIPHGGRSFLIGNLIEKGPNDLGNDVVEYLLGGASAANPSAELYLVNNTIVSDKGTGINFLNISASDSTPAVATNNIFYGSGTVSTAANTVLTANVTANPIFVNQAGYDYHLTSGSPAINTGAVTASADGISLTPGYEYLQPTCGEIRNIVGTIDVGAYEYTGAGSALPCALGVSGLALTPATVSGGTSAGGTMTLSVPAPGGTLVTLSSSNPAVASVPASVTVPSGSLSAGFAISTSPVTTSSPVTISASYSGSSQSAVLTVMAPVALSSLQCTPTTLVSGAAAVCTVTLTSAAPAAGAVVNLTDNSSLLSVPASVTVVQGASSATFNATAGTIVSSQSATVTASLNGVSKTAALTLAGPANLVSFACSPTSLNSGATSTCTVLLSSAAPAGGTAVALSSNTKLLSVPSSVKVQAGATSATFTASAGAIRQTRTATATASLGGTSLSVSFKLMR